MPENIQINLTLPEELAGKRLDQALSELLPEHSRSRLTEWIRQKYILIDGQAGRPRDKIKGNEVIRIDAPQPAQEVWHAEKIPLDIVYEDEHLLIINKPVGLVVHPAVGNHRGTLLNALLYHAPELDSLPRAGIIHRIDKETSGLLVIARTASAHTYLVNQLQEHLIKREYEAIIQGVLISGGTVNAPIARHPTQRIQMAVVASGKNATTHYRIIQRFRAHTHIKVMLETGRTHQIRVHMTHIRHPLVGDPLYGGRLKIPAKISPELTEKLRKFKRQALHARRLILSHPHTQEEMVFQAPIPLDMQLLLEELSTDALTMD